MSTPSKEKVEITEALALGQARIVDAQKLAISALKDAIEAFPGGRLDDWEYHAGREVGRAEAVLAGLEATLPEREALRDLWRNSARAMRREREAAAYLAGLDVGEDHDTAMARAAERAS